MSLHMEHLHPAGALSCRAAAWASVQLPEYLLGNKSECHLFTMTPCIDVKTSHLFSSRFLCRARQTRGISLSSAVLPLGPSFPLLCRQTDTHNPLPRWSRTAHPERCSAFAPLPFSPVRGGAADANANTMSTVRFVCSHLILIRSLALGFPFPFPAFWLMFCIHPVSTEYW